MRAFLTFTLIGAVLPFVASSVMERTTSCASDEFFYETKSCCVSSKPPPSPPSPPSGKTCPTDELGWYWSNDNSCCVPSSPPPPSNPPPSCPGTFSWDHDNSCCSKPSIPSPPSTPAGPSSCKSDEFWFDFTGCCLPSGGPPPSSPPSGTSCPSSWSWFDDKSCCVPHSPNPPTPTCGSGRLWDISSYCCKPSGPKPSSGFRKRHHKSRAPALCPTGLEACPIGGLAGLGADYECVETTADLESCGGCVSTGHGQDCTSIKGAWNVGCEQGQCKVYTCAAGYRLAADGKSCISL